MRKLALMLAALLALTAGMAGASAWPEDGDACALMGTCLQLCAAMLDNGTPERDTAVPAMLAELRGFLSPDAPAAGLIGEALSEGDDAAAAQALYRAASALSPSDLPGSFTLADFSTAADFGLLPVTTPEAFLSAFEARAAASPEGFSLVCPPEVLEAVKQSGALEDVITNCGIMEYTAWRTEAVWLSTYEDLIRYPGRRMLRAWQSGDTSPLTEDERRALAVAQEIVDAAPADVLARERAIHDALCERISYFTNDDPHDRNDGAVGALLDGLADCDGYSDAFWLCCHMAGIDARCQTGRAIRDAGDTADIDLPEDDAHSWNLVCLDGHWVTVDVTWDDLDPGMIYTFYNAGEAQARRCYTWRPETLTVPLEPDWNNALRDADLAVTPVADWDELDALLRRTSDARARRILFACPDSTDFTADEEAFCRAFYRCGVTRFSWSRHESVLEAYDIEYPDAFRLADTEAEVADDLEAFAAEGTEAFTLFFAPELAEALFADGHRALLEVLSASRLKALDYTFSDEAGWVQIDGAAYFESVNAFDDADALSAFLSDAFAAGAEGAHFMLPRAMTWEEISDGVNRAIRPWGVDTYNYSITGRRVTLSDATYFPEFATADTEAQILDYLTRCRDRGLTDFRVFCAEDLYRTLHPAEGNAVFDLLRRAGAQLQTYSYNDESRALIFEGVAWQ